MQPVAIFLMLMVFGGCSTTRHLDPLSPGATYDQVTYAAVDREARITLVDGRKFEARNIRMKADSTWCIPNDSRNPRVMATADVGRITLKDRGRGAMRGLVFGLLGGAAVGGLTGYAGGDDYYDEGGAAALGAISMGALGFIVGGISGTLHGYQEIYMINEEPKLPEADIDIGTAPPTQ
ncbi:MAG: hypothetical protein ABFS42_16545 [Candidatus Krumholzibacteriota bacterium]